MNAGDLHSQSLSDSIAGFYPENRNLFSDLDLNGGPAAI